jgi:hypothetical protein
MMGAHSDGAGHIHNRSQSFRQADSSVLTRSAPTWDTSGLATIRESPTANVVDENPTMSMVSTSNEDGLANSPDLRLPP